MMNSPRLSSRFSSRVLRHRPTSSPSPSSSSSAYYVPTGHVTVSRHHHVERYRNIMTTTTTAAAARSIATTAAAAQRHHRDDDHRGFASTTTTTTTTTVAVKSRSTSTATAASEHPRRPRQQQQQQHRQRLGRLASSSFSTAPTPVTPSHPFVLSHPSDVDHHHPSSSSSSASGSSADPSSSARRGRVVCITSGKGGVGKTTSAASFASGLALRGRSTVVVDFDMGLRNLDIHLGVERRVVFDFVHVLNGECTLNQALIPDRNVRGLCMLAASQTRDKDALTIGGVERVLAELAGRFEYVVLDSPAGIESGARHAMYFCDDAILVTNPELSSCRDADKMIGFISSRSRRAEIGSPGCHPVSQTLLITRYDPVRAEAEETLAITDMKELLGLPVIGVVPESKDVLTCTNLGKPVISLGESNPAAGAYMDMVDRFLGQEKELRFVTPEPVSFFKRIFG